MALFAWHSTFFLADREDLPSIKRVVICNKHNILLADYGATDVYTCPWPGCFSTTFPLASNHHQSRQIEEGSKWKWAFCVDLCANRSLGEEATFFSSFVELEFLIFQNIHLVLATPLS